MMDNFTTSLGLKLASLVAGFAGGVAQLALMKGPTTRMQAISGVVVGTLTSAYMTPSVVQYFGIGDSYENGVAFLIGLLAMQLIPLAQRVIMKRVTARADMDGQSGGQPSTSEKSP